MNGFLDTRSRLNRSGYITYCGGIALLLSIQVLAVPAMIEAYATPPSYLPPLATLHAWMWLELLSAECLWLVWTRRRLQDIGWNPNWAFLLIAVSLWLFIAMGRHQYPAMLQARFSTLVLFATFASIPGTPGANRFGPSATSRPGQVRNAIVICAALSLSWIGVPAGYLWRTEHNRQERVERAVQLAIAAEAQWRGYYQSHKTWPDPYTPPFHAGHLPVVQDDSRRGVYVIRHWLSKDGGSFVVLSSITVPFAAGFGGFEGGAAVWTSDGGTTWHCGPYGWRHIEDFPVSCKETGVPPFPYPLPQ